MVGPWSGLTGLNNRWVWFMIAVRVCFGLSIGCILYFFDNMVKSILNILQLFVIIFLTGYVVTGFDEDVPPNFVYGALVLFAGVFIYMWEKPLAQEVHIASLCFTVCICLILGIGPPNIWNFFAGISSVVISSSSHLASFISSLVHRIF